MFLNQNHFWANSLKLIIALVFPVYYLTLNYFNRYSMDDFELAYAANAIGPWASAVSFYFGQQGSFIGIFITNLAFCVPLFIYYMIFISVQFFALYFFFQTLWKITHIAHSRINTFLIASLILSSLYFSAPSIPELWHSTNITALYTLMFPILLFAISLLLRNKPLLATPFLVAMMQTRISWALILFSCYTIHCAYYYFVFRKLDKHKVVAAILMIISTLIYMIAPGNEVYRKMLLQISAESTFYNPTFIDTLDIVFDDFMFRKSLYVMAFLVPICFLIRDEFIAKIRLPQAKVLYPLLALILITIAHILLMYLATSRFFHAPRVWHISGLLFCFTSLYYLLLLKARLTAATASNKIANLSIVTVTILCHLLGLYLIAKTMFVNLPIVNKYAIAFDKTIELVKHAQVNKGQYFEVKPLPNSGIFPEWGVPCYGDTHGFQINNYYQVTFDVLKAPVKKMSVIP